MSKRDDAKSDGRAKSTWRTGRLSRWRATSDALLRQREGVAKPGDEEPDVVEEFLRERVGLFDVLFEDRDKNQVREPSTGRQRRSMRRWATGSPRQSRQSAASTDLPDYEADCEDPPDRERL